MPHDVFISHSHEDKLTADAACAVLERNGIRCWIAPRDVAIGLDYSDQITQAIEDCRALVLIFSTHSNASNQVKAEIDAAFSNNKALFPIRIEDVTPSKGMAHYLRTVHWLDAFSPPMDVHLQKLADTILRLLPDRAQPAAPTVPPPQAAPLGIQASNPPGPLNPDPPAATTPVPAHAQGAKPKRLRWGLAVAGLALVVAVGAIWFKNVSGPAGKGTGEASLTSGPEARIGAQNDADTQNQAHSQILARIGQLPAGATSAQFNAAEAAVTNYLTSAPAQLRSDVESLWAAQKKAWQVGRDDKEKAISDEIAVLTQSIQDRYNSLGLRIGSLDQQIANLQQAGGRVDTVTNRSLEDDINALANLADDLQQDFLRSLANINAQIQAIRTSDSDPTTAVVVGTAERLGASTKEAFLQVAGAINRIRTTLASLEQPQAAQGSNYLVKHGDTARKIATSHGITFQDLKDANPGVDWRLLKVGQVINIPNGSTNVPRAVKSGIDLAAIVEKIAPILQEMAQDQNLTSDAITRYSQRIAAITGDSLGIGQIEPILVQICHDQYLTHDSLVQYRQRIAEAIAADLDQASSFQHAP